MGRVNPYLNERAQILAQDESIPWNELSGATVLITGATGLVCSQLARVLGARFFHNATGGRVILPVRSPKKAQELFGRDPHIVFVPWESGEPLVSRYAPRYVVHGAAPTASRLFVEEPVEVVSAIVDGGKAALELAKQAQVQKLLFLSTLEIYGTAFGHIDEATFGSLDPMSVRSSYPEAKRLVECLCASYAAEYGVPATVLRLAQTFGEGVAQSDERAFAQFGRAALAGKDIALATDGSKKNAKLSVDDAVRAILVALVKGEPGRAYNAANDATYGSIKELAETAIATLGDAGSTVVTGPSTPPNGSIYPPVSDLDLDTSKLRALGWEPQDSLEDMFCAMAKSWEMARE